MLKVAGMVVSMNNIRSLVGWMALKDCTYMHERDVMQAERSSLPGLGPLKILSTHPTWYMSHLKVNDTEWCSFLLSGPFEWSISRIMYGTEQIKPTQPTPR